MNAPSPVPSGALALVGEAALRQRRVERTCLERLQQQGYREVLLPVLEYATGASDGGYRFLDGDGRLLALRTDFTPLSARILAPCLTSAPLPFSVCYSGEVLRPRPPRLRQVAELYQLGFERYGEPGAGGGALATMLDLVSLAGVALPACRLTVGSVGLADRVRAAAGGASPAEQIREILQVRDVDGLADILDVRPSSRRALQEALLGEPPEAWAGELGAEDAVAALHPLVEVAGRFGVPAAVDVAPRLSGPYYTGTVFSLWGPETRSVIAGGGEYQVIAGESAVPAAGACLALGMVLQEAPC